ncbi:SHOCT domain-containing protein [Dehalogenimonas etheniformans]|nr:SHOCT domain-containing protein [Dehalogenimonas etheniformans]QNT76955.1 SHOCT domain-containing protein [Dehalogenimonas etheniformans]
MKSTHKEGFEPMFGDWRFSVVIVVILVIVLMFVVWNVARGGIGSHVHDPKAIAKERYARGEITLEQFNDIKRNIR